MVYSLLIFILYIKDMMRNMRSYSDLHQHEKISIFFGLWSGISGIVALALNDKSQCRESHQTLMVLGVGLIVFSVFYFINCFISPLWKESCFLPLVVSSGIFVFVLDCMLIDDMTHRNYSSDCIRGTLRLLIVVSTIPFQLTVFVVAATNHLYRRDQFYGGPQYAEFQTLVL